MMQTTDWEIEGAERQSIYGTTYVPAGAPIGCALIGHGFKGYKDFRMIPPIARTLCEAGFVAHTFNFSHSGMTANPDSFERPDLFEHDTWNKQVFDIECLVLAIAAGELVGGGLPYVLFGHSRGGVAAILFGGRHVGRPIPQPAAIITAGTPDRACGMSEKNKDKLRREGFLDSKSARTGQVLRIGLPWLTEQEADPTGHDMLALAGKIECPVLVVHGQKDETVAVENSESIAAAAKNARIALIQNGTHVFNTPNPPPTNIDAIAELKQCTDTIVEFSLECCRAN